MYDDFAEKDPVANLHSRPHGDEACAWTFHEEPAISRKFARVTGAILMLGVNVRETADRDSPARAASAWRSRIGAGYCLGFGHLLDRCSEAIHNPVARLCNNHTRRCG